MMVTSGYMWIKETGIKGIGERVIKLYMQLVFLLYFLINKFMLV